VRNPWIDTSRALAEKYGTSRAEVFDILTRLSRELDKGRITLRGYNQRLGVALGEEVPYDYFAKTLEGALKRVPATWSSVRRLKDSGEVRVVALSNMSREVWALLQEKFDIGALFHFAVLSFEVGLLKPDPRIYRVALEASGEKAEACLFVDDTEENIKAAKALGLQTLLCRKSEDTAELLSSRGLWSPDGGKGQESGLETPHSRPPRPWGPSRRGT
jgi:HAD superfamily hydrolase (TIGR01549 family)